MLIAILFITVFAHLVVPILFLSWIYRSKRMRSKFEWMGAVVLASSYLILMWRGGAGWHWFGYYLSTALLILLAAATALSSPKIKRLPMWPPHRFSPWLSTVLTWGLAAYLAAAMPTMFSARAYPTEDSIELLFPFSEGVYHIAHGGSNEAMNHHYKVPAQRYALDIVKLNPFGTRANGLFPEDLSRYAIFGKDLLAPCTGEVIAQENNLPDLTPPNGDSSNPVGNAVVIYCEGASVILAHLQENSVIVNEGDFVEAGAVIGRVGNSGNTTEPHLHLHAVRGRHADIRELAYQAPGIPMLFHGKFLIRNDRVRPR